LFNGKKVLIALQAGAPYEYVAVPFGGNKSPEYQEKLTFGQLPAYEV
jgi:glutathione S-transferase